MRARMRECQNVHVTARSGTPCHSTVAPSFFIVYTNCSRNGTKVRCDKSWHLGKVFEHFKILATTWHALFYLTRVRSRRVPTHPHAHLSRVLLSLARQNACRGVDRLSRQCRACFKGRIRVTLTSCY